MLTIYGYIDYRKYLVDYIASKKLKNAKYSCRMLSLRLGISAATLVRILNGKRNLSKTLLPVFANHLKLPGDAAEYFSLMVQFAHVKDIHRKNRLYQDLLDRRSQRIKKINPKHYSLFEKWYLLALREIIDIKGEVDDCNCIAENLRPPVSVKEIKNDIVMLKNQEIIADDGNGRFIATDKLLSTGEKWENVVIQKYQSEMIRLAESALFNYPKGERDISTMTVGLCTDDIIKVKEILKRTRQEIMTLAEEAKNREYVYQINFQAFPLSNSLLKGQNNGRKLF
jgi:uncharacterized protein (TIGR02147 family)